ncbi:MULTISPECIES: IspD/TarI family cytidylyltransferase [Leptospira]|uniref:2-C-methyl-D-erythritol 4-phosphate cytidylyltransferase n=2 Tax=Leptospira kirschneri TaxID=29507 RepID=A0A1T1DI06_9LEPT|nr:MULTISPECIES: IspD/TarI family cytidylyltransferase [Leptospira]EMO74874.1 putative 2-C-methyl-D-erythritol 4-phosphate cytidylyltransferase [Leptospira kirschneri str. 200801925]EJO69626.1 putative 2-C-methyl-D-erythritol 4-phosphate cytidylyltransferase [Leptospira kirschneri serovar Grippotyphosa str. RM52]EKO52831.1 putative 2-C-methyl-D-erythritol 4-phosphate cytidylyltransferase [Leptospira kirschneri str. 200802841]EKP03279.1 putative 2-C-methyl-D-erythritol 4-phosphate cytidylyltrans
MKSLFLSEKIYVLILAGGTGSRMGSKIPKQFLELNGEPILLHSLKRFQTWGKQKRIVLVSHSESIQKIESICSPYLGNEDRIVEGGESRHSSMLCGLSVLDFKDEDIILIHDAARPFVLAEELDSLCEKVRSDGITTLASRTSETVLEELNGKTVSFLDREHIWFMKTPQGIRGDVLKELLTFSVDSIPTDLCSWALTFGKTSSIVESNPLNLKITRKEDLDLAEVFFSLFQKISSDI